MKDKIYIHYGSDHYDESLFCKIINREYTNKPFGGLWSSPVESDITWKEWCDAESFRECDEKNSFKFRLKPEAKILTLENKDDLSNLPRVKLDLSYITMNIDIDFEALSEEYDAIMVYVHRGKDYFDNLYHELYGWDCDTLLVMNKEVIEVIEDEEEA